MQYIIQQRLADAVAMDIPAIPDKAFAVIDMRRNQKGTSMTIKAVEGKRFNRLQNNI